MKGKQVDCRLCSAARMRAGNSTAPSADSRCRRCHIRTQEVATLSSVSDSANIVSPVANVKAIFRWPREGSSRMQSRLPTWRPERIRNVLEMRGRCARRSGGPERPKRQWLRRFPPLRKRAAQLSKVSTKRQEGPERWPLSDDPCIAAKPFEPRKSQDCSKNAPRRVHHGDLTRFPRRRRISLRYMLA
jgi:hypothetical protein